MRQEFYDAKWPRRTWPSAQSVNIGGADRSEQTLKVSGLPAQNRAVRHGKPGMRAEAASKRSTPNDQRLKPGGRDADGGSSPGPVVPVQNHPARCARYKANQVY